MTAELRQLICEQPDDDEPRLVYADWCEEHGAIDRATLIRTQIARAALAPWDVGQIALETVETRIIREHGERWLGELPRIEGVTWAGFSRGFVAEASVDSFEALVAAQPKLARVPVHRIKVPWPGDADEARGAAPIPSVRGFRIERAIRDPDEPAWLAEAPMLGTVRELELVDGYAPSSGTRQLLASSHLRGLRSLKLERHETGTEGVQALVEQNFPHLESLAITELGDDDYSWSDWHNGLSPEAIATLADWPGLSRIRDLDLSYNRIGPDEIETLFSSPHLTGLRNLDLGYVFADLDEISWGALRVGLDSLALGERGIHDASPLVEASALSELKTLALHRAYVEERDVLDGILAAPFTAHLQRLDLTEFEYDATPTMDALANVRLPKLHTLVLANLYRLEDRPAARLVAAPIMASVHALDMRGNTLGTQTARALASNENASALERLVIDLDAPGRDVLLRSALGKRLLETDGLSA